MKILFSGMCSVWISGKRVGTLHKDAIFGQLSLLTGKLRSADVRVEAGLKNNKGAHVLSLTEKQLSEILLHSTNTELAKALWSPEKYSRPRGTEVDANWLKVEEGVSVLAVLIGQCTS